MTNALAMLGLITLALAVLALLDWMGRRKDRRSHHRAG
jgi:hypothetical protein